MHEAERRGSLLSPFLWSLCHSQRGGALAETAIVLPFLLLMIFGMVWFGMLLFTNVVVQLAAAQGARVAAAAYADDPAPVGSPTPEEKSRGFVRTVIEGGLDLNDVEAIQIDQEYVAGESAVRVTVAYRFRLLVPMMDQWVKSTGAQKDGLRVVRTAVYRIEVVK